LSRRCARYTPTTHHPGRDRASSTAWLDLLAYQLLLKAGIDDEDRLTACAFPVMTDRDLSKPAAKKKHDDVIAAKSATEVRTFRKSLR
jgi:hypothetical protein